MEDKSLFVSQFKLLSTDEKISVLMFFFELYNINEIVAILVDRPYLDTHANLITEQNYYYPSNMYNQMMQQNLLSNDII